MNVVVEPPTEHHLIFEKYAERQRRRGVKPTTRANFLKAVRTFEE